MPGRVELFLQAVQTALLAAEFHQGGGRAFGAYMRILRPMQGGNTGFIPPDEAWQEAIEAYVAHVYAGAQAPDFLRLGGY